MKPLSFALMPVVLIVLLVACSTPSASGGGSGVDITQFKAEPDTVSQGQTSTLSWAVANNPDNLSIDNGVGTVSGRSVDVTPTKTTTYTLRASNSGGVDTASVKVTVTAPGGNTPPTVTAIPNQTLNGEATSRTLDLTRYFNDAEDGASGLRYSAKTSDDDIVEVGVDDTELTISYKGGGEASVMVTAKDSGDLSAQTTFTVRAEGLTVCQDTIIDKTDTQGDIERAARCNIIDGLLVIEVNDLGQVALPNLVEVSKTLAVSGNTASTTFSLNTLKKVGGNLMFQGNTNITSVAFPELSYAEAFDFRVNPGLRSISSPKLATTSNILIAEHDELTSVDLGGLVSIDDSLIATENQAVLSIDLRSVNDVGGTLFFTGNKGALSINLAKLTAVGTDLVVSDNGSVTSLALDALREIGEQLLVGGNNGPETLFLPELTSTGGLAFLGSSGLTNIKLPKLAIVDGDLALLSNTDLITAEFPKLVTVQKDFGVSQNPSLVSMRLDVLATIGGNDGIYSNINFDCSPLNTNPPPFFPVGFSTGNKVDCDTE